RSSSKARESVRDDSDSFSLATSGAEQIGTAYADLSLRETLLRAFESDGMPVLIAFPKGAHLDATLQSEPMSVSGLALPLNWDDFAARVSSPHGKSAARTGNRACFGDVCIDFFSMEVSRSSGEQIAMTAQEFKALKFFVSNPRRVISRDELLNHAWGYD